MAIFLFIIIGSPKLRAIAQKYENYNYKYNQMQTIYRVVIQPE